MSFPTPILLPPATAAVIAINAHYGDLGGADGFLGGQTGDLLALPDGIGFAITYEGGSIYWTSATGAQEVHGDIGGKWFALGAQTSFLGYPVTDETGTPDGVGRYNHFQGGSIYWTPGTGAHEVHGDIRGKWASLGWETSFLGYPVTDETGTPDGVGRYNHFQGGSIYWTPGTGAHEVHGDIRGKWASLGWETSFLGYPVTDETGTPDGVGRYNHFQGGSIYWTPGTGAHEVHGDIRGKWASLGWETSFLGYPVTDETGVVNGSGRFNDFQGGSIYWTPTAGAHEVHGGLPNQLTYDSGPIVFGTGIAAGGTAHVIISSDGSVHFQGSMHDSGAWAYNYSVACVVVDADQHGYAFTKTGNIAGTFESGSRDDAWDTPGQYTQIAQNWRSLVAQSQGHWDSTVSGDAQSLLNTILGGISAIAGVVSVVLVVAA